jgi:hypothetical protein
LLQTSNNTYLSSQYGSIWFTRDTESTVDESSNSSSLFSTQISERCAELAPLLNYTSLDDCANFQGIGFVLQYNFTGLHTAPTFQSLADQALARYATNDPTITITTTIAPLPITVVEKSFGQSEDAFLAWFLVSSRRRRLLHFFPFLLLLTVNSFL